MRLGLPECSLFLLVLSINLLVSPASGALGLGRLPVYGSRPGPPPGWEDAGLADPSISLSPLLLLRIENPEDVVSSLYAVSEPSSPRFRQFLSKQEVDTIAAPSPRAEEELRVWLREASLQYSIPSSGFVQIDKTSIERLSSIFECEFHLYQRYHAVSGQYFYAVAAFDCSLPRAIGQYVHVVGGLTHFPKLVERKATPAQATDPSAPIISKASPGDGTFNLFYLPKCADGSLPDSSLHCGSTAIEALNIEVTQQTFTQSLSIPVSDLHCQPCGSWASPLQSECNSTSAPFNYTLSAMYCLTQPIPSFHLRNYVNLNVTIYSQFASGVSSTYQYPKPFILGEFVTPQVLLDYYGVPEGETVNSNPFNSQSVAEFLGQYFSDSDLADFYWLNGIQQKPEVQLVGQNNPNAVGIEASLDIQYLTGLSRNTSTIFWSVSTLHFGQEPFLQWIAEVLASEYPPLVNSISYGDDENTLTSQYMERVSQEFAKAGAKGITLLFSAGDTGVNSGSGDSCTVTSSFTPAFPASSPYVTTVGGTQFSTQTRPLCSTYTQYGVPTSCNMVEEIVASIRSGARITSGGGFSNVFPMPDYQKEVVGNYLSETVKDSIPSGYFNSSGRAYPDISACARNFIVVNDGSIHPTDGTSCAAPTASALMAIINSQLLDQSLRSLGWLNPLIYSMPASVFNDVTLGSNKCGETIDECCPYGFEATFGWDAVTGFGSINFPAFRNAVMEVKQNQTIGLF